MIPEEQVKNYVERARKFILVCVVAKSLFMKFICLLVGHDYWWNFEADKWVKGCWRCKGYF